MQAKQHAVLGMVFLVAFLDMVGFSVIFPLFPQMMEHYVAIEGADSLVGRMVSSLSELAGESEAARVGVVTLFGGVLGSLYSLLQFVCAPFWGALSDRIGRRSTLLFTLSGMVLSYALWCVSGSFTVLIAARILGGIMAGNISIASAVVSDITEGKDRAKGMGMLGMGIGLGFILGPAIGGGLSTWRLSELGVETAALALNPFSGPAIAASVLALINLAWVAAKFPETLPAERRGSGESERTRNPFAALSRVSSGELVRTTWAYFVFLFAFSAMEFTLTFLAYGRFGSAEDPWTERDNMWMFVFVGLLIAFVQGGAVRRMAPKHGERKLALVGVALVLPGFLLTGLSGSVGMLYAGLFFMAVGSAFAMPTLSALASRYAPAEHQGLALGAFRSAGALSRALGPILGGVLFWKLSSTAPYLLATVLLVAPLFLVARLPEPPADEPEAESSAPVGS